MESIQHRYFIYVRKSTGSEERQVRSIRDQFAEIRDLVSKHKLNVVRSFEESQSAMTKGRPIFNEMLDRIEAGEADGIVAWHPDRLARNAYDGGRIIDLIDERRIRDMRFCSFWFEPTAQGKLMLNMAFGQSKYFSDSLSVNIRRGQEQKTKEGVWGWKAPVGYLNEPRLRTIVVDPAKGPLIKMVFDLYASGKYTLVQLRNVMNAKGLRSINGKPPSPSQYQHILKNPFYYGVFVLNGEMHEATHEPLTTKSQFDMAQAVMQRRSKPNTERLKTYVYRGLFKCGECGCGVTMETQKGHNYLRCTKRVKKDCSQRYVREERMSEQIGNALMRASLPDSLADSMIQRLTDERTRGLSAGESAKQAAEKAIIEIDKKLDRLAVGYLDEDAFSPAEFRKRKEIFLGKKRQLLDNLAAAEEHERERFEPVIRFINGSAKLKYVAQRRKPSELRKELEKIGSNLTVREQVLYWEPRGAWQRVVDHGSFAQHKVAPEFSGAPFGW